MIRELILYPTLGPLADPAWVPTADDFPPEFTLREFELGSQVPLSTAHKRTAWWWVYIGGLLEARTELRAEGLVALRVTSLARRDDGRAGCHESHSRFPGYGVDVVPVGVSIRRLWRWFVTNKAPLLGEILDETFALGGAHLHLSRYPCGRLADGSTKILALEPGGTEWERG